MDEVLHTEPSRTALATAYARAFHQIAPEPRVFIDPLAIPICGLTAAELTDRDTANLRKVTDPAPRRNRRMFLAARARFAEEVVQQAVAGGVRQVAVLGAGLDTFAYRNPYPGVRVVEVDHPNTQEWKRERLASAGIEIPDSMSFAPVDFETGTLGAGLAAVGWSRTEPAAFVWLGVVMYLEPATVRETLGFLAAQDAPVHVVADYLQPPDASTPAVVLERAAAIAAMGEPFQAYFSPDDMAAELRAAGFTGIDDHGAAELLVRYGAIHQASPGRRWSEPHVVHASK
ncbi:class I SAM-dependent methyltransferase [Nocardia stercoris]